MRQKTIDNRQKTKKFGKSLMTNVFCLVSNSTKGAGFTLVEMLVAATILATLAGGVILSINPVGQIEKGQDAQKQADLSAIKTALDLYYSDNKCYPQQIPFGNEWRVNNTVYMKKVPQDPKCNNGTGSCYRYRTDSNSQCPQWSVTFAQLSRSSALTNACPISSLSNCSPAGYSDATWACVLLGAVNCESLQLASIAGTGEETVNPTNTPTPPPSSTPTPTPTPPAGSVTYDTPDNSVVDAYEVTIMPLFQTYGLGQSIRVRADDTVGNITSVIVVLYSDGDARQFTLTRTGGTDNNGTWTGSWQVTDTYNQVPEKTYGYDIITTDNQNPPNVDRDSIRVNR